jgi:Uma2 family endonuclease
MASASVETTEAGWTVADLSRRFGPMPLSRFRQDPAPGSATEADVVAIYQREKLLYELIDGILVRKTMGAYESLIAGLIITFLNVYARPRRLGSVLGPDGMIRLNPDLVRIPDVSFIAARRLPKGRFPRAPICPIVPDLAVEVLSEGNTKKEMDEKLADYVGAGVRLVWLVDPSKKSARVFTGRGPGRLVREHQSLDGGAVLPGFSLALRELFAEPAESP